MSLTIPNSTNRDQIVIYLKRTTNGASLCEFAINISDIFKDKSESKLTHPSLFWNWPGQSE